jgi:hypothetical protein
MAKKTKQQQLAQARKEYNAAKRAYHASGDKLLKLTRPKGSR